MCVHFDVLGSGMPCSAVRQLLVCHKGLVLQRGKVARFDPRDLDAHNGPGADLNDV